MTIEEVRQRNTYYESIIEKVNKNKMSSITENVDRIGNFTSSEIAALMTTSKDGKSFGKPALTYIEEKNMERRLGRSLDSETNARPLTWGKLIEKRVFDLLGLEYTLTSQETVQHPTISCWSGSQDGNKFDDGGTVIDIKCPITLKSFCQLVDGIYQCEDSLGVADGNMIIHSVCETHKDGEKYYWQLVSNAILTNSKYAELIVYVPYKSELPEIRELANNYDGNDQHKYAWIVYADDNELPYLPDDGYYKNLNIIRFLVPESDKILLTEKVLAAQKLLINA